LSLKLVFDIAHSNLTYKSLTRDKNIAAVCQRRVARVLRRLQR